MDVEDDEGAAGGDGGGCGDGGGSAGVESEGVVEIESRVLDGEVMAVIEELVSVGREIEGGVENSPLAVDGCVWKIVFFVS